DDWDTLLLGVEAPGGGPANPRGEEGMFNRALTLEGRVVRGLVVRDLHFVHHYRAIEILPEWATPDGECGNRTRVDGAARGVTIVRNRFTDNTLGVTLLGRVHGATVRANVFERHAIFGAVVEGRSVDCPLAGGGAVELALATPRRTVFRHNRSIGSGGLGATFTERTTIVDNRIRGAIVGILAGGDRNAAFRRNTITDGDIGFALFADESTMRIRRNVIDVSLVGISALGHADAVRVVGNTIDGGLWGLQVGAEASGYHAIENHYGEHLIVDVELGVGSSGNSVVNNDGLPITVSDQGIDNRVEGNIVPF
ncbi:MAG: right-handed parallel beta-helix repeat-containing protein, partial [Acidobacteriota bacterium]